jgi:chromate transporter
MLWAAPVAMLWLLDAEFLTQVALFFSKLAIVTFGGAYAVLAYMAQAVVDHHNWLTAAQMIDALGLAETTPGPLILVTQFVAQIAGFDQGGLGLSLMAGIIALWVTFVPCFLWVFTFAPHVERLLGLPQLAGALAAITAAVVGVIANLSLWFALHVFFAQVDHSGTWPRPVLASLDLTAVGLTIFAALIFWGARRCILTSLALCAAAGIVMAQI